MSIRMARPRLLPLTILALAALLGVKSIVLVRAATSAPAALASAGEAVVPAALAAGAGAAGPPQPSPTTPLPSAATPVAAPAYAPSPSPAAASPSDAPAPVSPAERALLQDLRARSDALSARSRALDERQAVLDAAEHKLAQQAAEMSALQKRLESLDEARKRRVNANWDGMVKMYEAMRPRDAAAIFDDLDMATLLPVLDRMQDRKAALVVAAMQPARARLATQMLAKRRLDETAVPPAGGS